MTLVAKKIKGKTYYYSFLSYFLVNNPKSFSKYVGAKRPRGKELAVIEELFKKELVLRISGKEYSNALLSTDDVIRTLLFRDLFNKKYTSLNDLERRKYDIDSTVSFTLTTLTTEEVDVDLKDIENALKKKSGFTTREQISKNMLNAVERIKLNHKLDEKYLLELHGRIMSGFEGKTPGKFRKRQVYLYRREEYGGIGGVELSYKPPGYEKIEVLIEEFLRWHSSSPLNPIEKAAVAHYKLYAIHPFLDGNKRICRLIFNKILLESSFPLINISLKKEEYFDALVKAIETHRPKVFVDFALKQYYIQVRRFLK